MTIRINGQEVDIKTSTSIALTFRNSAFVSADKISNSYSNTITMPRTARNEAVFGCVLSPSSVNSKPYQYLRASIDSEGVQIVKDAIAYITEVTPEDYKVVIVWDTVAELAQMVKEEKTINQLTPLDSDFIPWTWDYVDAHPTVCPEIKDGIIRGGALRPKTVCRHPVLKAVDVLSYIANAYSMSANYGGVVNNKEEKWRIPLITRHDYALPKVNIADGNRYRWTGGLTISNNQLYFYAPNVGITPPALSRYFYIQSGLGDGRVSAFNLRYNATRVKVAMHFVVRGNDVVNQDYRNLRGACVYKNSKGESQGMATNIAPSDYEPLQYEQARLTYDYEGTIDLPEDIADTAIKVDGAPVTIKDGYFYFNFSEEFSPSIVEEGSWVELVFTTSEVQYGNRFYLIPNLPPIKCVDYIKAFATLTGSYVIAGNGGLSFLNYKSNILDKSKASDWSAYVTSGDASMKFQHGDWARENVFSFKEKNGRTNSATFTINNDVLDKVKEFTVPFVAGRANGGLLEIPMYSYDGDSDEPTFSSSDEAYLAHPSEDFKQLVAPVDFAELIYKYDALQEALQEIKVLKLKMRIPFVVLASLNMNAPIYLSQYGCYFAIITIRTSSNGEVDVELLKI